MDGSPSTTSKTSKGSANESQPENPQGSASTTGKTSSPTSSKPPGSSASATSQHQRSGSPRSAATPSLNGLRTGGVTGTAAHGGLSKTVSTSGPGRNWSASTEVDWTTLSQGSQWTVRQVVIPHEWYGISMRELAERHARTVASLEENIARLRAEIQEQHE